MLNRILIYNSGGGIGDALQIIPLINALKLEFKDAELHYLCAHENHFNSSLNALNIKSEDLGHAFNPAAISNVYKHIIKEFN